MERFFLIVVLSFTWTHQALGAEWNYVKDGPKGPSKWEGVCQTGQSQTPIDIKSEDTTWKKDFGAFNLVNYDQTPSFNFTASNNGHTFQISFDANYYNVSGAGLVGTFTTVQFHLHWGATNAKGSEHFLDGKQYAAELHFVSYNTKYADLGTAVNRSDGLAVLGVFLAVEGDNNTNYEFLEQAKNVINKNTTKEDVAPFMLKGLLPTDLTKFFRYSGSLTTPGCFESVTWTVFKDVVNISQYQMDLLRMLKDSDDGQMVDNFRPLLALNGRTVYSSFNASTGATPTMVTTVKAHATAVSMTAALFLLMLVAAFFMH